jgi:hypothetical protein
MFLAFTTTSCRSFRVGFLFTDQDDTKEPSGEGRALGNAVFMGDPAGEWYCSTASVRPATAIQRIAFR